MGQACHRPVNAHHCNVETAELILPEQGPRIGLVGAPRHDVGKHDMGFGFDRQQRIAERGVLQEAARLKSAA